jgi:hypothetical protein
MKFWPVIFLLTGCSLFMSGPDQPRTAKKTRYIIDYKHSDWFEKTDDKSDYVFENKKDARIFLSNSFCDEFQEQSLDKLARKIFKNIQNFKMTGSQFINFKGREAFKSEGYGQVDGVNVNLILMNTRRDNCYFDFLSITPSKAVTESKSFDDFLNSVEFK